MCSSDRSCFVRVLRLVHVTTKSPVTRAVALLCFWEGWTIPRRYNEPGHLADEVAAFQKALGRRLRELRKKRDLSVRDMTVLHGYADAQYRRMEREGVGSTHSLIRLAKIFQISVADLLEGIGQHTKSSEEHVPEVESTVPRIATWSESAAALKRSDPVPSKQQNVTKEPRLTKQKLID